MGHASWDVTTADDEHVVKLHHGALTQRVQIDVDERRVRETAPRDPFEYYEWSSLGSDHPVRVGGAWRTVRIRPGLWGYGHELRYEGEPPSTGSRDLESAHPAIVLAAYLFGLATLLLAASLVWEPHSTGAFGAGVPMAGAVSAWALLAQHRYLRQVKALRGPAERGWVIFVVITNLGAVLYAAAVAYSQTRDPAPPPQPNDPAVQLVSSILTVLVVFAIAYALVAPLALMQVIVRTATGSWPGDSGRILVAVGPTLGVLLLVTLIEGASDWYRPVRGLTVLSFGLVLAAVAYAFGRARAADNSG